MNDKIKKTIERLSSPEQIDQMLNLAQPITWYPLLCIFLLIGTVLIWSFVGRIPTEISGNGVSLSPKGVFSIQSKTSGIVTNVGITEGKQLNKGDYIATIYNSKQIAILTRLESALYALEKQGSELLMLQGRLHDRKALYEQGLIAKTVFEDTQSEVTEKLISIEAAKASLETLLSELEETSSSEVFDKKWLLETLKGEHNLKELEDKLSEIYSPSAGKVLEVLIQPGDFVDKEKDLVWMEYPRLPGEKARFYAYFPVQMGNKVHQGMPVRIEPTIANPQEYGSIIGKVLKVSPFSVSEAEMFATLRNRQLVNYLTAGAPAVVEVIVEPKTDNSTPSTYAWTSKEGPPFPIPTGTVCSVKITVEEQPPISYLIPLWKIKPTVIYGRD